MESEWRYGVAEYGLWGAGLDLIARVLTTGEIIARPSGPPWPGQYARVGILNPDYGYEIVGYYGNPGTTFPMGFDVNPD